MSTTSLYPTTPLTNNIRGKTRLAKWYNPYNDDEKIKLKGEIHRLVAPRDQKHQSNFVEFRGSSKIVYRRYAGLFFCACVDANDNELAYLEAIHFFVEVLDQFFGNVCELDLVFNFYKVCGSCGRLCRSLQADVRIGVCYTRRGLPSGRDPRDLQASRAHSAGALGQA